MSNLGKRWGERTTFICKQCGKPFELLNSELRYHIYGQGRTGSYCSKECQLKYSKIINDSKTLFNSLNQPWNNPIITKNGMIKRITFDGYVCLKMPEHPRASKHGGWVREHILVWEKEHNQLLQRGFHVHHINGIKNDNAPENVIALIPSEHMKITGGERWSKHKVWEAIYQKRIRELEEQLKILKGK